MIREEAARRIRRARWAAIAMAAALAAAFAIVLWPALASAAPRSKEQKLLNAILNKKHPDGKGPSSTSSGRGYYKGTGGNWRSR